MGHKREGLKTYFLQQRLYVHYFGVRLGGVKKHGICYHVNLDFSAGSIINSNLGLVTDLTPTP